MKTNFSNTIKLRKPEHREYCIVIEAFCLSQLISDLYNTTGFRSDATDYGADISWIHAYKSRLYCSTSVHSMLFPTPCPTSYKRYE